MNRLDSRNQRVLRNVEHVGVGGENVEGVGDATISESKQLRGVRRDQTRALAQHGDSATSSRLE